MKTICIIGMLLALGASNAPEISRSKTQTTVPPVSLVQKMAIEHARLEASEISSWRKRARLQALLPKLQVGYERRLRNYVNVDVTDTVYVGSSGIVQGPDDKTSASNSDIGQNVEVKAVWSFNEAIFNPDVLNVSAEARALSRDRQFVLAEVNKNYYERERLAGEIKDLSAELKKNPRDPELKKELFAKKVSFDEATAGLDALTGGWFSTGVIESPSQNVWDEKPKNKQRRKK